MLLKKTILAENKIVIMETNQKKRISRITEIIDNIPNEKFRVEKTFGHDYFASGAVVRNEKLSGREEDIKFLESVEPNTREQFLKEAKVLSALHHNNIPKLYDIIEHDSMLLFRSEHIEGYSLKEVLEALAENKGSFPRDAAASIILKLMNALYYAHNEVKYEGRRRCIIHCDIKPSNIIISAKGYKRKKKVDGKFLNLLKHDKIEPYLIDFGISKFKGDQIKGEGTLQYLSPEQIDEESNVKGLSWHTDMYQLLLVYSEMLTSKKPYQGLSRKETITQKNNHDFAVNKRGNAPKNIIRFIEKGTRREIAKSFRSEKECLNEMSRIERLEKISAVFKIYKKPIVSTMLLIFICFIVVIGFRIWDSSTRSTDAIIRMVENNPNPSLNDLEDALMKLQERSFEKKYYEPLKKGGFRDKKTGKPMYPSYLDNSGKWVLGGQNNDGAGAFVGLLFEYSDKYPDLLDYAKEYAEPILESEFDGASPNRFGYALIAGYEKTKDERYLRKLINITESLMNDFNQRRGMTQCADLSLGHLFIFVYKKTEDKRYLDFFESYLKEFIRNNIDEDGYIYEFATVNASSPYGQVPDDKMERLATPSESLEIGEFLMLSSTEKRNFKNITSVFSRDLADTLQVLEDMYNLTEDPYYDDALERSLNYYEDRNYGNLPYHLFATGFNDRDNLPKDNLAIVKMARFLKEENKELYHKNLKNLLSSGNFRKENENGVLSGNVIVENMHYIHSDEDKKNQTIIEADTLFLELKIKK